MSDERSKKTDNMSEAERDAYHADKMRKKKEARTRILATKTEERGLLIVHTGKGKGKSTAAFGMVFRAIGHGFPLFRFHSDTCKSNHYRTLAERQGLV